MHRGTRNRRWLWSYGLLRRRLIEIKLQYPENNVAASDSDRPISARVFGDDVNAHARPGCNFPVRTRRKWLFGVCRRVPDGGRVGIKCEHLYH